MFCSSLLSISNSFIKNKHDCFMGEYVKRILSFVFLGTSNSENYIIVLSTSPKLIWLHLLRHSTLINDTIV